MCCVCCTFSAGGFFKLLPQLLLRGGRLVVVILVKAYGDSESRIKESIIRAICDKLAGGVAEL